MKRTLPTILALSFLAVSTAQAQPVVVGYPLGVNPLGNFINGPPFGPFTSWTLLGFETWGDVYLSGDLFIPSSAMSSGNDIGGGVFSGWLPVTAIAQGAFYDCPNLVSVVFPSTVTSINASYESDEDGWPSFGLCPSLTQMYFMGNAPDLGNMGLANGINTTIYYLPSTSGWGSNFNGSPTILWNPTILTNDGTFGISNNQFGFTITGTPNIPIMVMACTNLNIPTYESEQGTLVVPFINGWTPLTNVLLTNGSFYFSEPLQTTSSGRFYKISPP
jgi:hypothetical protein